MVSSENIVTLVYNILVKTAKIPEKSEEAHEIWNELNEIKKFAGDVDLLMGL